MTQLTVSVGKVVTTGMITAGVVLELELDVVDELPKEGAVAPKYGHGCGRMVLVIVGCEGASRG